jgi:hypothetical protein
MQTSFTGDDLKTYYVKGDITHAHRIVANGVMSHLKISRISHIHINNPRKVRCGILEFPQIP